jgi:hypothetical protein
MILYEGGEDISLRTHNSSTVYCNGSKHKTNSCGIITVLGQETKYYLTSKGKKKYLYFIVQFGDGTKVQITSTCIRGGRVKNPNQPNVFNTGFMGQGKGEAYINGKITKECRSWSGMMRRCYYEIDFNKNPTYKACTVKARWHNFQNFCKDIQYLEGYKEWKENNIPMAWALDKDIKVKGNKIYSKDTCQFVSTKENCERPNKKQTITGLTYIGTRLLDGHKEEFTNQSEFASKYDLTRRKVCACVKGDVSYHKGWEFSIKGEDE